MERIFTWLLSIGYPNSAVEWLRHRSLLAIAILAVFSWVILIGLGWLIIHLLIIDSNL